MGDKLSERNYQPERNGLDAGKVTNAINTAPVNVSDSWMRIQADLQKAERTVASLEARCERLERALRNLKAYLEGYDADDIDEEADEIEALEADRDRSLKALHGAEDHYIRLQIVNGKLAARCERLEREREETWGLCALIPLLEPIEDHYGASSVGSEGQQHYATLGSLLHQLRNLQNKAKKALSQEQADEHTV